MTHMSTKTKGSIAQAFCTAYFVSQGHIVSQPLYDNAVYDLIVDNGDALQRVQCKLTSQYTLPRSGTAKYPRVNLFGIGTRTGPRQTLYTSKSFDLLWVMTDKAFYLIPSTDIFRTKESKYALQLSPRWNAFLVDFPHPSGDLPLSHRLAARLTASEQQRIVSLFHDGMTPTAIAQALGLTRACVSVYLSRKQLTAPQEISLL